LLQHDPRGQRVLKSIPAKETPARRIGFATQDDEVAEDEDPEEVDSE
jgi:hypothetical protein